MTDRTWCKWAAGAGLGLGLVSLLSPWQELFGLISRSGIDILDGQIAAAALVVAGVMLLPILGNKPLAKGRIITASLAGVVVTFMAGYHMFGMGASDAVADAYEAGIGTYLGVASGLAIIAAALGSIRRTPAEPHLS